MKRHKKIVLLAHCILNQNAVVYPLARANGGFNEIICNYLKDGYGLYQLPCPELQHLGLSRMPMSKEDYNTTEYKDLCHALAQKVIEDIRGFVADDVSIDILHGINESPTCSITAKRGHFMEVLIPLLRQESIPFKCVEVMADYTE